MMFSGEVRDFSLATLELFSPRNLRWHALAIVLTLIFALSGFDWLFYESTRSPALYPLVMLAGLGGFVMPVVLPLCLFAISILRDDDRLRRVSLAIGKAVLLGLLLSFFYKAFTGRAHPEVFGAGLADITRDFKFGFLRGGVFWGWPSSHATVAFAGSVALYRLSELRSVRMAALAYASFVALGAAVGFHWFSDVVAGAIFGSLVGFVVAGVAAKGR